MIMLAGPLTRQAVLFVSPFPRKTTGGIMTLERGGCQGPSNNSH